MLFRHRQRELRSALQPLREICEPIEVHCVEFERLYAMDPLPAKPCRQLHSCAKDIVIALDRFAGCTTNANFDMVILLLSLTTS